MLKRTLHFLLSSKFGELPESVTEQINSAEDPAQLNAWLENYASAKKLQDVGLSAKG